MIPRTLHDFHKADGFDPQTVRSYPLRRLSVSLSRILLSRSQFPENMISQSLLHASRLPWARGVSIAVRRQSICVEDTHV